MRYRHGCWTRRIWKKGSDYMLGWYWQIYIFHLLEQNITHIWKRLFVTLSCKHELPQGIHEFVYYWCLRNCAQASKGRHLLRKNWWPCELLQFIIWRLMVILVIYLHSHFLILQEFCPGLPLFQLLSGLSSSQPQFAWGSHHELSETTPQRSEEL